MASTIVEIDFVDGDRLEDLFFELENTDISTYPSITLRIRKPDNTLLIKTATIDDAPNGKFHFEWASGDLTTGNFEARVKFEVTAGVFNSIPKKEPLILAVPGKV